MGLGPRGGPPSRDQRLLELGKQIDRLRKEMEELRRELRQPPRRD
jgi:hypothetical protein